MRIIVAFTGQANREKLCEMLERRGVLVSYRCKTGAEVQRTVRKLGEGLVITGYKLPDLTADELCYSLGDMAQIIVIAKQAQLDFCEHPRLSRLGLPLQAAALLAEIERLQQRATQLRGTERTEAQKQSIAQAKAWLIERNCMTENEAHRYMQRKSMEHSCRMTEVAELILQKKEEYEQQRAALSSIEEEKP